MSRTFTYPPSDSLIWKAIDRLTLAQWAKWQCARAKQGVVWGAMEFPGKFHPDVLEEYENLPPHIKNFAHTLTIGRIMFFASIGWEKVYSLIQAARNKREISSELTEEVARAFHQGWWLQRQAWGLSGHSGDKDWDDETDAEKANDLKLVPGWAELLSACLYEAENGDEEMMALMDFLKD